MPNRSTAAMVALGAAAGVLAIGYFLASPGTEHAAPVADLQATESWPAATPPGTSVGGVADHGGWGSGGNTMMPGHPMMAMPGPASGPNGPK
jgi:hypothetical protein